MRIRRLSAAMLTAAAMWVASVVAAEARTIRITTELMAFMPASVDAQVGDRMVWSNGEDVLHEVYFPVDPQGRGRPNLRFILRNGHEVSLVLTRPGDFVYFCRWHDMQGMIHVSPRSQPPPS